MKDKIRPGMPNDVEKKASRLLREGLKMRKMGTKQL